LGLRKKKKILAIQLKPETRNLLQVETQARTKNYASYVRRKVVNSSVETSKGCLEKDSGRPPVSIRKSPGNHCLAVFKKAKRHTASQASAYTTL